MIFFSQFPYLLALCVKLYLLVLLLQGPFRKYPVFSAAICFEVVTNVMVTFTYFNAGVKSPVYRNVYWTDEITHDLFLFLVVIAFTYEALRGNPLRAMAGKVLAGVVVIGLALPASMLNSYRSRAYGMFSSQWFNHASQIFNFAAAIMNLVLWTALLTNRKRDPQLVMLSIGLGILTAAASIAWGLRQFLSQDHRWPLDIFVAVAEIAALLIWCNAIRRSRKTTAVPPNAPPTAPLTPSLGHPSQI